MSLQSIDTKLGVQPILIQMPVFNADNDFIGLVDLISMEIYIWSGKKGDLDQDLGKKFLKVSLNQDAKPLPESVGIDLENIKAVANESRCKMIDQICDFNDLCITFRKQ